MRGFDTAERIVAESVGANVQTVANDPALRKLAQCVEDMLPSLSRACRRHGDGVVTHSLIAMTANLARDDGLQQLVAEAFRVNAAMLDSRPIRYWPFVKHKDGSRVSASEVGNWLRARLSKMYGDATKQVPVNGVRHSDLSENTDVDYAHENDLGPYASSPCYLHDLDSSFQYPKNDKSRDRIDLQLD